MRLPRGTLALRAAVLTSAIVVITGLIAGGVGVQLVRDASKRDARQTLSRLADAAQATADIAQVPRLGQQRATATLRALQVQFATIQHNGHVVADSPLARDAVTPAGRAKLLRGGSLSTSRTVDSVPVLIEGRGTNAGAILLVQRRSDALRVGEQAQRGLLAALLIAVGVAILIGLFFAWQLARPLRRTAQATRALASGRRDVTVPPQGPTEVAEVAESVNVLAGALAHSEARQREFLMSVSHDLRTPLTAITGYAESLADGVIGASDVPRAGQILLGESRRLERLVQDLLDLARLEAQEFRVDITRVDVTALVQAAGAVWSARCAIEGVRFGLETGTPVAVAMTDPVRLRQALDGLLENALRVTPADAPIVLGVRHEPGAVAVEVRDGGPGLTDADLAVAFDRSALYNRYRGVREVGTGLGLAIVHRLITRIGGTVQAGHAAEGGARFTIRLPPSS